MPARMPAAAALALMAAMLPTAEAGAAPGDKLSAEEFERLTTGRTLYYNAGGEPYGVEQYRPGRRVVWAFVGDDCRNGFWYEDAGDICFVYEDEPDPQCWTFYRTGDSLLAQFRGDPLGEPLVAVEESPEPMACLGPNVGV